MALEQDTRVVAVDIGGTKIASALVTISADKKPHVEFFDKVPTEAYKGGEHVLELAVKSVKRVLSNTSEPIEGIGVSSGGVIDPISGDVSYANEMMPGWGGTALGKTLENTYGLKTRVLNDVHAHALGEARWGAGKAASSCLVVAVGTGIGGAFVERGTIMLGAHNEAGHIGHVSCIDAAGIPCSCGASGHLEPIAAGPGIIARYKELGGSEYLADGTPVDGAIIDRLAQEGNRAAIEAETRSGHALGEVLASLTNMLDPDCIILSGSVAKCGDIWHSALKAGWTQTAMPPVSATPILSGALTDDAPLIGAAEHLIKSAYIL